MTQRLTRLYGKSQLINFSEPVSTSSFQTRERSRILAINKPKSRLNFDGNNRFL